MASPNGLKLEQQLYANLMDEARQRIHTIRDLVDGRDRWPPRFLQEFCYLQLRMLCELIAVGCLVAHGEVKNLRTLKNWKIPDVVKEMEALNPDFYPRGVRFRRHAGGLHLDDYNVPQLTKGELVQLWQRSGEYLHRGTAVKLLKEDRRGPQVNTDEIVLWGLKVMNLLEQHIISSSDRSKHLLVALASDDHGGNAGIWLAEGPAQDAT